MEFHGRIKGLAAKETKTGVLYSLAIDAHLGAETAAALMEHIGESVVMQVDEAQTRLPMMPPKGQQMSLDEAVNEQPVPHLAPSAPGVQCDKAPARAVSTERRGEFLLCDEHVHRWTQMLDQAGERYTVVEIPPDSASAVGQCQQCTIDLRDAGKESIPPVEEGVPATVAPCGKPAKWLYANWDGKPEFKACDEHKQEYDPEGKANWEKLTEPATCEVLMPAPDVTMAPCGKSAFYRCMDDKPPIWTCDEHMTPDPDHVLEWEAAFEAHPCEFMVPCTVVADAVCPVEPERAAAAARQQTLAPSACGEPAAFRLSASPAETFSACVQHKQEYDPDGEFEWLDVSDWGMRCEILGVRVEASNEPDKPEPPADQGEGYQYEMCVCGHMRAYHAAPVAPGDADGACSQCSCPAFRPDTFKLATEVQGEEEPVAKSPVLAKKRRRP